MVCIATDTGIAPIRSFVQWLFPENEPARHAGNQVRVIYGTSSESDMYYRRYFEGLAANQDAFEYISVLSDPPTGWEGLRGTVQDRLEGLLAHQTPHQAPWTGAIDPNRTLTGPPFAFHAYICGLKSTVVAARTALISLGWGKKQIVSERYD